MTSVHFGQSTLTVSAQYHQKMAALERQLKSEYPGVTVTLNRSDVKSVLTLQAQTNEALDSERLAYHGGIALLVIDGVPREEITWSTTLKRLKTSPVDPDPKNPTYQEWVASDPDRFEPGTK